MRAQKHQRGFSRCLSAGRALRQGAREVVAASSWQLLDSPIIEGDCRAVMEQLPDACVDAVVTDPPYGIGFMGHEWDQPGFEGRWNDARAIGAAHRFGGATGRDNTTHSLRGGAMQAGSYDLCASANQRFQAWCEGWGREALRVLKPGAHAVVFGAPRTFHRLTCGLEDAGFEIRDTLAWMFGSGFPKSLDVSKAIDRAAGQRPVVGRTHRTGSAKAQQWGGWGTALKPGYEPIVLARKPLVGTVAQNVLTHGLGALNVDGCRIGPGQASGRARAGEASAARRYAERGATDFAATPGPRRGDPAGRWPANVVLDCEAAALLDEQSGELRSGFMAAGTEREGSGYRGGLGIRVASGTYGDAGGASRFFYCAKVSRWERDAGLGVARSQHDRRGRDRCRSRNVHPTVKPIRLMAWLLRLVTPPGGVVLDPFAGSGSTNCAGATEGIVVVGIERDPKYVALARTRAAWWADHPQALTKRPRTRAPGRAPSILDAPGGEDS